uniref:Glycosyltransferase N-terminal domain-containing protein n=1 Tax=Oryza punctata TaxID=4537 RepID=A0A0E0KU04_ORYPU
MAEKGNPGDAVAIVAVPFPAQGHLNQLLHLSLQLASHGFTVHYAAPAPQLRQAQARVHGWDDEALHSVQFHDLGISAYVSPPPDSTADSPFPSHLIPLWEAYTADARAPLAALLDELSASYRRLVVICDIMNSFAVKEAVRLPNGEAFVCNCVAVSSATGNMDPGHRLLRENGLQFIPMDAYLTKEFMDYEQQRARAAQSISSCAGILANACRALEGEFIDVFAQKLAADSKKLFAIGPLNPLLDTGALKQGRRRNECLDWLDRQPPESWPISIFVVTGHHQAQMHNYSCICPHTSANQHPAN